MSTKIFEETFSGFRLKYCFNHDGAEKYMYPYIKETDSLWYDIKASEQYINMHKQYYTESSDIRYIEYKSLINLTSLALLPYKCCIIHAAAFKWKGYAWLMTGPSGAGKTTQYKNWKKTYPVDVEMICGDMPILEVEENKTITVHPSPWNGKERIKGNTKAPLGGIIILEQSNHDEIMRMRPEDSALPLLYQFAVIPQTEQQIKIIAELENDILRQYPVWRLRNEGNDISVRLAEEEFLKYIQKICSL